MSLKLKWNKAAHGLEDSRIWECEVCRRCNSLGLVHFLKPNNIKRKTFHYGSYSFCGQWTSVLKVASSAKGLAQCRNITSKVPFSTCKISADCTLLEIHRSLKIYVRYNRVFRIAVGEKGLFRY